MTTTIYKVGQLAGSSPLDPSRFYETIENIEITDRPTTEGTELGLDKALSMGSSQSSVSTKFLEDQTYYITLKVSIDVTGNDNVVFKLVNSLNLSDSNYEYQYLHEANISQTYSTINFSFTPVVDFQYLLVEIQRNSLQLTHNVIIDTSSEGKPKIKKMKEFIGEGTNYEINHFPIIHIGVWGDPRTLLFINHQEISIGPRAYYELENYDTYSLSLIPYASNPSFSLDYEWAEEVGDE